MSTFNGPEFAAEARTRLARADMDAGNGLYVRATFEAQAAGVLANLALLAALAEALQAHRDVPGNRAWRAALGGTD